MNMYTIIFIVLYWHLQPLNNFSLIKNRANLIGTEQNEVFWAIRKQNN